MSHPVAPPAPTAAPRPERAPPLGVAARRAMLDAVLDDARTLLDADAASVREWDDATGTLRLHRTAGALREGELPLDARPGEAPCGLVVLERAPVASTDFGHPQFAGAYAVPLQLPGEGLFGCLTLYRRAPWTPDARERRLLEVIVEGRIARIAHRDRLALAEAELAARRGSESALQVSDLRFRRIFDANVLGIAIAGPDGVVEANDEYLRHAGATRDDLEAGRIDWQAITPPEYLSQDFVALEELLATGEATAFEKEYVHADGTRVRIFIGASLLSRDPVRWIAFTLDVTARHRAELAVAERMRDWETLFELAPVPLCVADDPACTRIRANAAFLALLGLPADDPIVLDVPTRALPFRVLRAGVPQGTADLAMQRAAATGTVVRDEEYEVELADGRAVRLMSLATPLHDAAGRIRGALGAFVDITAQRGREDLANLHRAVGDTLARSLDYEATLQQLPRLVVPALADWAVLDLVEGRDEHGRPLLRRVTVAHHDPARAADAQALVAHPADGTRDDLVLRAIETATPQLLGAIPDAFIGRPPRTAEHAAILRRLGTHSAVVQPLVVHGHVRGTLTFVRGEGRAPFAPTDLDALADVGERAALALDNAVLFREAQQASEAKSAFLATMSHELRTPLNAILGYTWLLDEGVTGPVTDAQREQLGRVKVAANHLLALIDEVLTLSRLEAGHEKLHPEPLDARALVGEITGLLAPSAAQRGLALDARLPAGAVPIVADATRLRQVLLNLVSNAVKFTDRGGVTITLATDADWVQVQVDDTGVGIAPQHLERIFESFWRVESDTRRRTDGAGLGLAITHRLVELMGGTLGVESRLGEGSSFRVRLPRGVAVA
jgi:PAS domain S-box-containing protein